MRLLLFLTFAVCASAQVTFTRPVVRGTTVPGSCVITGQIFIDTDATAGQNAYVCNGSAFAQYTGTGAGGDELGCSTGTSAPTTGTAYTCYIRTDTTPDELWIFVATDTPYFVNTVSDMTVAGGVTMSEATANGSNYRRLLVSDSLSSNVDVKFFEGTLPTNDDCVKASVTGSVVSLTTAGAACGSGGGGGLSGSSAIDFASIGDGSCLENTFTLTGLAAGDVLSIGLPSTISSGILATGIASATDTAKIRLCNLSGAAVDLASLTYSVTRPTAISASSAINFGSIGDGLCASDTFTLTGAAAGTRITPGYPAALESGLQGTMAATATDTIQVRLCNFSGAAVDPASGTFSAAIF